MRKHSRSPTFGPALPASLLLSLVSLAVPASPQAATVPGPTSPAATAAHGATPRAARAARAPITQAAPAVQAATPEHARTASLDERVPVDPAVRVGQFANGMRYWVRENQEPANRAELRLVVRVGSVVEDDDQLGLAHFLEHMAFNGTENFEKQELIDFMESIGMRLGPDLNASTSFDETVYMVQIPTDSPEVIATAFEILEDWAHRLTLTDEEIDKERGVVIEEWRLGQGAGARIRDQQFPVIFRGSRYAERLPIGTRENLETFDPEAVRRFYRDWYRPDLMAVIAVGDVDGAEIEARIRQHFEPLPAAADPRERPAYGVPDHEETRFAIATDPEVPTTSVSVYHKMPIAESGTVGEYRQSIVEGLYNSMLNRRLSELAQRSDPPFVFGSSGRIRMIGSLGAYALSAGVQEGGIERGLEALFTEAERVARFGFTETELERQKTVVLRGVERAHTNRSNRNSRSFASEYIRAFLADEPIPGIEYEYELYQRFLPEITLEEINQVGRDWIHDDNRVVVVTAPEKDGMALPTEDDLLAVMASAAGKEITAWEDTVTDRPLLAEIPAGSTIVATRTIEEVGITEWDLANGVTVALKPTDFEEDEIVFRAISPGGTSLASDESYVPASQAVSVIAGGGLGDFNAVQLRNLLSGKVASVRPFIGAYEEGLRGSASPKDLETLFQLIYMSFTQPRADATYFEVWGARTRAVLENRDVRPATAFSDTLNRIMNGDHPRTRPPTIEDLERANLEESLAFYRDRFADASDFTFIFVGNLDLETIRPLVERYLGGLPSIGRVESWRDLGIRPPTGVIEETVHKGMEPQSRTSIIFTGPFPYDDQSQRTGIRAMASILQTRLRDVLREELGATYSVGAGAGYSWRPEESYRITISFGSDPARAEEMVATIFDEIGRLKDEGPTEGEVSDAQQALLRGFETSMEENGYWLTQLAYGYQRGVDPAAGMLTFPASVEALTPAAIQEVARRYLDVENWVRVTLLPEEAGAGAQRKAPSGHTVRVPAGLEVS